MEAKIQTTQGSLKSPRCREMVRHLWSTGGGGAAGDARMLLHSDGCSPLAPLYSIHKYTTSGRLRVTSFPLRYTPAPGAGLPFPPHPTHIGCALFVWPLSCTALWGPRPTVFTPFCPRSMLHKYNHLSARENACNILRGFRATAFGGCVAQRLSSKALLRWRYHQARSPWMR